MRSVRKKTVEYFVAYIDGVMREISTDYQKLASRYKGLSPSRIRIEVRYEEVPVVDGKLHNWGSITSPRLKLHWNCPYCGFHEWGDFSNVDSNPCLWFANCGCTDKVLIVFDPKSVFHSK